MTQERREVVKLEVLLTLLMMLLLIGCGLSWFRPSPLSDDAVLKLHDQMTKDDRSACFSMYGMGMGAAVAPMPGATGMPMLPGGFGKGQIIYGRSGSDDAEVTVTTDQCTIKRGQNANTNSSPKPIPPKP